MKDDTPENVLFAFTESERHLLEVVKSIEALEARNAANTTCQVMIASIIATLTSSYLKASKGDAEILSIMISEQYKKHVEITIRESH